ncbi:MAG: hypothetical protein JNM10_07465 [Planctomycetia bacterium]|nr:hypothetical protein [Planctomycetia bacterium]
MSDPAAKRPNPLTAFFRKESAGLERLLFALVPAFLVGGLVIVFAGARAGMWTIVGIAVAGVLASKRLFRG